MALSSQRDVSTDEARTARHDIINRRVIAWSLWDWGSAAFNAVATTFVFSVYLTSGLFGDKDEATESLSLGLTVAGILIALLAPITGQRSDRHNKSRMLLGVFTFAVVTLMAMMFFVRPDSPLGSTGALWLGIALLGFGNVFFEFASVNYNAMLNYVSTPKTMGRISGIGWGSGYVGGIVLLLVLYLGLISDNRFIPIPQDDGLNIRVAMVIAALWFALSAIPVLLTVKNPHPRDFSGSEHESIIDSYRLLWATVKRLAKEAPHTLWFLLASAVFRDGLAGVFTFGAIIAAGTFGFSSGGVMIFGIAANIVAGIATMIFGMLDDRFGSKAVIILSLISMVVSGLVVFFLHDGGQKIFWIFGLILCVFVGPAQSASRAFLARVIPQGREGEVFGLYATTGRAVSFLAPLMYYQAVQWGKWIEPDAASTQYWGILGILLILLIGLIMVIPVKGHRAHLNTLDQ